MKNIIPLFILILLVHLSYSQPYDFVTIIGLDATEVISQGKTGTF